jgi:DNA-directed RNA polymerase specialized sigma24 family protein
MSSTQNVRQPEGIPIGGQYAAHNRHESDVVLLDQNLSEVTETPISQGLSDREVLEKSIIFSRQAAIRWGLSKEDAEDIAQDTVYSVLMTKSRNGGTPVEGGLIRVASRAVASRLIDPHRRHEDSKALMRWKSRVEQLQIAMGRTLTVKESDNLALDIRKDWENKRHRPSVGFQNTPYISSFEDFKTPLADILPEKRAHSGAGSKSAHELADQLEDKSVSVAQARSRVWNAIAGDLNVEQAKAGATTVADAKALRRVKNAVEVARSFKEGAKTPEIDALFLPFGPISDRQKGAIARAIVDRPEVGHKLWLAARDFSHAK